MSKYVVFPALLSLAAAACSSVDKLGSEPITPPKPVPSWSSVYTVPYDAMVACLSAPAARAESRYVVKRVPDGTIQVDWIRVGTVGGLDWLDVQARQRANRCGGIG